MSRLLRQRLRRRVVVSLLTGETFTGVLWGSDRQVLVLRNAVMHQITENVPPPVDGELVVEWEKVAYVQVLGSER